MTLDTLQSIRTLKYKNIIVDYYVKNNILKIETESLEFEDIISLINQHGAHYLEGKKIRISLWPINRFNLEQSDTQVIKDIESDIKNYIKSIILKN